MAARHLIFPVWLLLAAVSAPAATVVDSTWVGSVLDGGTGVYSNPENWSPAQVPNNTPTTSYNVTTASGFGFDTNATISNLTVTGGDLSSNTWPSDNGYSLTVLGSTTLPANCYVLLTVSPSSPVDVGGGPITFSLGSLSTFANGVLNGAYTLGGPATLQFNGADVRRLSSARVFVGSGSRIMDENGANGLRNLAQIDADSSFGISGDFTTVGDFTCDGALSIDNGDGYLLPARFVISGSLTNFDVISRTLRNGTYSLFDATLQFTGADIVNNGTSITLFSPATVVDQAGHDALRNFSHNLSTGEFVINGLGMTTSGDFTNDGVLTVAAGSFKVGGSLTNYDPATKTLNGGTYQLQSVLGIDGHFTFNGADIVNNNATIAISANNDQPGGSAAIADENGNDALRHLATNQQGGVLDLAGYFNLAGDFTNAGQLTLYGRFTIPSGSFFRQTGGSTYLSGSTIDGSVEIDAGVFSGSSILPDGHDPWLLTPSYATVTRNLTIVGGVLQANVFGLYVNGDLELGSGATLNFTAEQGYPYNLAGLNVAGGLKLGGKLAVEYPSKFPPGSEATYVIAQVTGAITGGFSNVASGSRITTTDGAGSFVFSIAGNQLILSDYQRTVPPAQLLNISTRALVLTGDDATIGGFIVTGSESMKVIIRALGPSLAGSGVSGTLQDLTIELRDAKGALIATNDNWSETQAREVEDTGIAPGDFRESAIVATLQRGSYTVIVRGKNNTTGVALVEVYDLSKDANAKLANISTRGFVDSDHVLIGGVIVGGNGHGKAELVVRAIGSGLEASGVTDFLADPSFEMRDENGASVAANDDFDTPPENTDSVPPSLAAGSPDAATGVNLAPGKYTVIVSGKNGAGGNALVEIYDLND